MYIAYGLPSWFLRLPGCYKDWAVTITDKSYSIVWSHTAHVVKYHLTDINSKRQKADGLTTDT